MQKTMRCWMAAMAAVGTVWAGSELVPLCDKSPALAESLTWIGGCLLAVGCLIVAAVLILEILIDDDDDLTARDHSGAADGKDDP